ncbi:MAG: cobalt-precorrin 5A hydrolase [Lachnospiraceae bacterium]|jgi:cobalt-precorrin 5A hydrolase
MKIAVISFSQSGYKLGEKLYGKLTDAGHEVRTYTKSKHTENMADELRLEESVSDGKALPCTESVTTSLSVWTGEQFQWSDAIVFIGACGIAIRSIAPFVKSKKLDPAVVVMDEQGKFSISLLSGHIGGANELAHELAEMTGAIPVVTTATDLNQKFAVDVFAKKNDLSISDMVFAKEVSAALVAGKEVGFYSEYPWTGSLPDGLKLWEEEEPKRELGIYIGSSYANRPFVHTLYLIPRTIVMGIGCRKGTEKEKIERIVHKVCEEELIPSAAIEKVVSIDLKKEERGLLEYCKERDLPFITYTKEELEAVSGNFSGSEFVRSVAGVDNVCERSAVLGSDGGRILRKKYAEDGVTVALAIKKWSVEFE